MRTGFSPFPAIANRILCELKNPDKYLLFVKKYDEMEKKGKLRKK